MRPASSYTAAKQGRGPVGVSDHLMNAALFYPDMLNSYSSQGKQTLTGPAKAYIVNPYAKKSPKRDKFEKAVLNAKLKDLKKNNFYEE